MKGGGKSYSNYTRDIGSEYGALPKTDGCDFINFITELQNLQPALEKYVKGDLLKVVLLDNDNVGASGDHGLCGYITALQTTSLITCLKKGKEFKAAILNITPILCEVRIRPLK